MSTATEDQPVTEEAAVDALAKDLEPVVAEALAAEEPGPVLAPEPSPESLALGEIKERNREIVELTRDFEAKNDKAKTAKKRLEAAQEDLNRFISKLDEKLPLFDKPKAKKSRKKKAEVQPAQADDPKFGETPARKCNGCGEVRVHTIGVCPYCQSPEFSLVEAEATSAE